MSELVPFEAQLKEFAQNPHKIGGLVSMLSSMTPENINPQTLRNLIVLSPIDVPAVVEATLQGEFIVDLTKGETMRAFTDEATVLVFDYGLPIGYYEMADGQVHREHGAKEYGNTLLPYAARKGARRWHLESIELSGMDHSIRDPHNNQYLRQLGPEGVGVFIGDASVNLYPHRLVIGVSGAQMTEEFLGFLTGGNVKEHTLELFAGIGDVVLAEGVAQRIENPGLVAARIHPDILQLAIWH